MSLKFDKNLITENLVLRISGAVMTFDEAWLFLQEQGINKIIDNLDGIQTHQFTSDEYMRLYTKECKISLYYYHFQVLASLRGRKNEDLLQELLRRWNNHKIMTRWLARFFYYLNRYFIVKKNLPTLVETSHLAFYNLVYGEINSFKLEMPLYLRLSSLGPPSTIFFHINREREGEQIDQALGKGVLDIYVDIAEGSKKYYEKDFEEGLNATAAFYSKRALGWITNDSYEDYMLKADECLNKEKTVISNYLKFTSKDRILEIAERELFVVHASKLEGKKQFHEAVA